MSCIICANKNQEGALALFPCTCDQFVFPEPLRIDAGLGNLPRQLASFPEFRRAMLNLVKTESVEIIDASNTHITIQPLADWRARDADDPGIMLLEMWAYLCDSLSFYDEVIANEVYLRTSQLRPSLRRLVALLGYLPRPAVGSIVQLAALADGRIQLRLPAGTGFRSGAFDGNPPQVFELDKEAFIHPLTNKWVIESPHPGIIQSTNPTNLLVSLKAEIKEDALLLLTDKSNTANNQPVVAKKIEKYTGNNGEQYTKITFTAPLKLAAGTPLANLQLQQPSQNAGLWKPASASVSVAGGAFILDAHYMQLKPGALIIAAYQNDRRWYKIAAVADINRQQTPDSNMTINGTVFNLPGVVITVTELDLDTTVNAPDRKGSNANWNDSLRNNITIYFGMQTAALITDEPKNGIAATDALQLSGFVETPVVKTPPVHFLFQDKNTNGAAAGGVINFNTKKFTPDQGVSWSPDLVSPVQLYGNVITASRGETVLNEKMGSGNASLPNQSFKLKKKPLTYHLSPTADNDNGTSNSLSVYVSGVKWKEVNSFYGVKEDDQVYIVRQNDEGDSFVTFGDGIRGQRPNSGVDNIIGNYRFGAEAACPPAGAVNQVAKPVKGLQSVKNMLPATGGADAEPADELRTYAPKSALVLGRVVSLQDMEALAAAFPGVRAVKTEWRWNRKKQSASAHIYYVGDDGIAVPLTQRLHSYSDPYASITVEKAQAVSLIVSLQVQVDPRYLEADVVTAIRHALMDKRNGMLAPENIGIGTPLYRSQIFKAVLAIPGAANVDGISLNHLGFNKFAVTPGTGRYYDLEAGKLIINGKEN